MGKPEPIANRVHGSNAALVCTPRLGATGLTVPKMLQAFVPWHRKVLGAGLPILSALYKSALQDLEAIHVLKVFFS